MRTLGDELAQALGPAAGRGEPRPAAQFNIGARACAEAAPDGYTICILPSDVLQYNRFVFKIAELRSVQGHRAGHRCCSF